MTPRYSINPADTDGGMAAASAEREADDFITAAHKRAKELVPLDGGEPNLIFRDRGQLVEMAEWARTYLAAQEETETQCDCDMTGPLPPAEHIVDGHRDPRPVARESTDTRPSWDDAADLVLHNAADPAYVGIPDDYSTGYRQGLRDAVKALRVAARVAGRQS